MELLERGMTPDEAAAELVRVYRASPRKASLASNVAAAERGPLPQGILDAIGDIYAMCPQRPYLEPLGLYFKPDYNRNDD